MTITAAAIEAAIARLAGVAHRTPVLTSQMLNAQTQSEIFFKCENFQRSGSFKFRGAYNAMAQLDAAQRQAGVVTFSSGNHGQALALAGQILNVPVTVVMPDDVPAVKLAATRGYGAMVTMYDRETQSREALAQEFVDEQGLTLIPPFDHPAVIAGQGTVAWELIEEVGALDALFVCVGGGGLIAGSAIALRQLLPRCELIGVEPKGADDATRSFVARSLQRVENPKTMADGARTNCLGELVWPIFLAEVDDMVAVSEAAIGRSMLWLWERMKIVVEPTGVLGAVPLLDGLMALPGKRVGVIVSGGNVDLLQVGKLFAGVKPKGGGNQSPKGKSARHKSQVKLPLTWEMS